MKKVITMVGTSLFENYLKEVKDNDVKEYLDDLEGAKASEYENEKDRRQEIKTQVEAWIDDKEDKENISAEVKSLIKLKEKFREEFEIYLLCTDTIISILAAEILKNEVLCKLPIFENDTIDFCDKDKNKNIILDLQVFSADEFLRGGLSHLTDRIYDIAGGSWDNVLINITGGYKVIIPYLTILAQINKVDLYYIFEDTEDLIHIPPSPLNIDFGLFEKYSHILSKIEEGVEDVKKLKREIPEYDEFYSNIKTLLWEDSKGVLFNPLGEMFWKKYKNSLILQIPRNSHYFRLTKPEKQKLQRSALELYERLKKVISGITNKTKESVIKEIISLGEQNDLRHASVIDKDNGVFIFKSTRETHIRLLYSFDMNKIGEITSIIIYDFVLEKFQHDKYINEFKKMYPDLKSTPRTYITIPKGVLP